MKRCGDEEKERRRLRELGEAKERECYTEVLITHELRIGLRRDLSERERVSLFSRERTFEKVTPEKGSTVQLT